MTMSRIFSDEVKCISTCGVCGIPSPRGRPPPRPRRPDRGVRVALDCLVSRGPSDARGGVTQMSTMIMSRVIARLGSGAAPKGTIGVTKPQREGVAQRRRCQALRKGQRSRTALSHWRQRQPGCPAVRLCRNQPHVASDRGAARPAPHRHRSRLARRGRLGQACGRRKAGRAARRHRAAPDGLTSSPSGPDDGLRLLSGRRERGASPASS